MSTFQIGDRVRIVKNVCGNSGDAFIGSCATILSGAYDLGGMLGHDIAVDWYRAGTNVVTAAIEEMELLPREPT